MKLRVWLVGALVTALTLAITGCGSENSDEVAEPSLVDTASILLPLRPMHGEVVEEQMLRFFSHLQTIPEQTMVTDAVANVRFGPGRDYDTVTVLPPGVEVVVDGQLGHWYRIADAGGYVSALVLDDAEQHTEKDYFWNTFVANSGSHQEVDECLGGLTDFVDISNDLGRPFYTAHNYCGGEPIDLLELGQRVVIDGSYYEVVEIREFPLFGNSSLVRDVTGDVLLHTEDIFADASIVVGLAAL